MASHHLKFVIVNFLILEKFVIHKKKTEMYPINIETKLVGNLEGEFYIPAFHRTYNWRDEVNRLLHDFQEIERDENYYFKPIVVRKNEEDNNELIDGQQRLMTLFILIKHIEKFLPMSQAKFSINYQKKSRNFLEPFDFNDTNRQTTITDEYFFQETTQTIINWFNEQEDETQTAIDLWLRLCRNIHVIRYEVN